MHARGGCATCRGLCGNSANGGGFEKVAVADQVVGEPHVFWFFREERYAAGAIAIDGLFYEAHGG